MLPDQVFAAHGIQTRRAGSWLAINASWRGGENFSVHVHPVSGGWVDKVSGEKGNFSKLVKKLGLGEEAKIAVDKDAVEQARQASYLERAAKQKKAISIYEQAYPIGRALDPQVELHGKTASQKAYWRDAEAHIMNYLESRGGKDAAIAAGARWTTLSKREGQRPEPCIVWPIRDLENGKMIGIQREWGRGHENKRMLGSHIATKVESGGFGSHATTKVEAGGFVLQGQPNKVYLAEGMQTAAAVWRATGCITACLYDTSGMQNPPIKAISRARPGTEIVFAGDRDANRAGQTAALLGASKVASANPDLKVSVVFPPNIGEDWADMQGGVLDRLTSAAFTVVAERRRIFSGKAVPLDKGNFAVVDKCRREVRVFGSKEVDRMPEFGKPVVVARGPRGGYRVTQEQDRVLQRGVT